MISRHAILTEARSWIGTPYQHQASAKGAGCDCLGLVRGVWRALWGDEPEIAPPPYGWEPLTNGLALPRTNAVENTPINHVWHLADYPVSTAHRITANSMPNTDRYRVPFVPWRRYTSADAETPYQHDKPFLWHPYFQSRLKGDVPVIGQDIFMNLTAGS